MTASVEFFCTPEEEREVVRYLAKADGTRVFDVREGGIWPRERLSADDLSAWPKPVHIYLWQSAHGSLIWHTSRPSAVGPTHGSLVTNLFAGEAWDKLGLSEGDKMLDLDLSPIISYRRGAIRGSKIGQNRMLAPPTNLNRVGPEYERWVKRSLAHIRRRGTIVHDYRTPSLTISNPDCILNTIYAFPRVLARLQSGDHDFAIMIQ